MRFFGLTPKVFACSVALHTTALAGFGLSNATAVQRGIHKSTVVGVRLIAGGASSAQLKDTASSEHKSTPRHKLATRLPRTSQKVVKAATKSEATATSDSIAAQSPALGAGHPAADASGDSSNLTKGLRLIAGTVDLPPYTDDARVAHFEGTLEVEVAIDEQGHVASARLLNPTGYDLDTGVVEAARLALYEPPVDNDGRHTAGRARLKFRFHLDPASPDQRQL